MKPQEPVERGPADGPTLLVFEQTFQPMLGGLAFGVIEAGTLQSAQLPGCETPVRRSPEQLVQLGGRSKPVPASKLGELNRHCERIDKIRPRCSPLRGGEPRQTRR